MVTVFPKYIKLLVKFFKGFTTQIKKTHKLVMLRVFYAIPISDFKISDVMINLKFPNHKVPHYEMTSPTAILEWKRN